MPLRLQGGGRPQNRPYHHNNREIHISTGGAHIGNGLYGNPGVGYPRSYNSQQGSTLTYGYLVYKKTFE